MTRIRGFTAVVLVMSCWHAADAATSDVDAFGTVQFPVACEAATQESFNTAVAILHSFWYPEAQRRFQAIADADPACAMAYWGLAMTHWTPLWRPPAPEELQAGEAAAAKARSLPIGTERERDFIDAIAAFYEDSAKLGHAERALAYETRMQALHQRYPDDTEAAVFYALALVANQLPTDKTYAKTLAAADLLDRQLAAAPNHPGIAHYLIHALDYPSLAERALPAARAYAAIAPSVAHAQHMPSHIFSQLGMWPESAASNRGSAQAAQDHASVFDLAHALEWQAYADLQTCNDAGAEQSVQAMLAAAQGGAGNFAVDYSVVALPARFALERGDWAAAAALPPSASKFPYAVATALFTRALGQVGIGELDAAKATVATLRELAKGAKEGPGNARWLTDMEVQLLAAEGWLAAAGGDLAAGTKMLNAAADRERETYAPGPGPAPVLPAQELLADLQLRSNEPILALATYEQAMRQFANRYRALIGAARAATAAKKSDAALDYYGRAVKLCTGGGDRDGLTEARQHLALAK